MGYLFLTTALLSLGGLGILHKVADHRRCRPASINMFLFLWAALFTAGSCVLLRGLRAASGIPLEVAAAAGVCGLFASVGILNFQHGIRYGKISASWLVINLSTAIPTLLSIWVYHEQIGLKRSLSLLMAAFALLLLWLDRREEEARTSTAAAAADEQPASTVGSAGI